MVDVHCHLNFHAFEKDTMAVIADAKEKGVVSIINVGTKLDSSEQAVALAKQHPFCYAIVGIHPHHADKLEDNWVEKLEEIAQNPKVVAIGEVGIDYFSYKSNGIVDPKKQEEVFEQQIFLAHKLKLPLQIHTRHAGKEVIAILSKYKHLLQPLPGMFHCFAGSKEFLHQVLDLGFYVGFDGNITYAGLAPGETTSLSELVLATPLDRIVTETDSPFLTPIPHRGSRNMPGYVIIVGEEISKIKHIPFEEVQKITTENAQRIFRISV